MIIEQHVLIDDIDTFSKDRNLSQFKYSSDLEKELHEE